MEKILQQIYDFGDKAHGSQMRKYTDDRYMVHCKRVMEMCQQYSKELPMLAAALLHDVLEDTPMSKQEIQTFLLEVLTPAQAKKCLGLIVELTDVYVKSAYPTWNRKKRRQAETQRIAQTSPEAQTIKYADMVDNCIDIARHDPDFAKVFLKECEDLLRALHKGIPELRQRAFDTIKVGLEALKEERL